MKTIAIIICKCLAFVGKLVGKGTSMPGAVALKLCPAVLSKLKMPEMVIAVTGSNGKTSTVEFISNVFLSAGKKVVWNKEGSNQIEGITTLLLTSSTICGRVKGDVCVLECDERYTKYILKYVKPTHFVVTNLYRDQLTRNVHPFFVLDSIKEAVSYIPDTTLVLNADDPIISTLGVNRENCVYFGMEENGYSLKSTDALYNDCEYCPVCGEKMSYSFFHFAHLGGWECLGCGYKRREPNHSVTKIDLENKKITVDGCDISLAFSSRYNVYNICACVSVCLECGIDKDTVSKSLSKLLIMRSGRVVRFKAGDNNGILITSKHENSTSYNQGLEYVIREQNSSQLVIIVDAISRKYYTSETSWLWDISFEALRGSRVKKVLLCGKYAFDLGVRFENADTGIAYEVINDLDVMKSRLEVPSSLPIYVLTCFSDKDKLFSRVKVTSPTAK